MNKEVYMHIGLPKCASTSIQYSLYSCKDMDFGGLLPIRESGKFWANDDLAELFDCELRFSACNIEKSRDTIMRYIQESNKTKIVFSSENITLRFLPWDLPTWHKLRFLRSISPDDTLYLFAYRNPYRILVSLYKEMVLLGYPGSFEVFCTEVYKLRQISFFDDILLDSFLGKFDSLLPPERLVVVYSDSDFFEQDLSRFFGERITLPDEARNVSMTNEECEMVVNFNRKNNDYNLLFDSLELHRINRDWEDNQRYSNARKRRIRKAVAAEMIKHVKPEKVIYRIPPYIAEEMVTRLSGLLGRDDHRINKPMIERYLSEIDSMTN